MATFKFKIGDRVVVTGKSSDREKGKTGTIQEAKGSVPYVRWDDGYQTTTHNGVPVSPECQKDMELIPEEKGFKVGDVVRVLSSGGTNLIKGQTTVVTKADKNGNIQSLSGEFCRYTYHNDWFEKVPSKLNEKADVLICEMTQEEMYRTLGIKNQTVYATDYGGLAAGTAVTTHNVNGLWKAVSALSTNGSIAISQYGDSIDTKVENNNTSSNTKMAVTNFEVGDKIRYKTTYDCHAPHGMKGAEFTILCRSGDSFFSPPEERKRGGSTCDCREAHSWITDASQLELVNKKSMFKKLTTMMKKLLSVDTQKHVKVGYINGDLELTDKGTKTLLSIVYLEKIKEMTEMADAEIAEEEKD